MYQLQGLEYVVQTSSRYFPEINLPEIIAQCVQVAYERNTSTAIQELKQRLGKVHNPLSESKVRPLSCTVISTFSTLPPRHLDPHRDTTEETASERPGVDLPGWRRHILALPKPLGRRLAGWLTSACWVGPVPARRAPCHRIPLATRGHLYGTLARDASSTHVVWSALDSQPLLRAQRGRTLDALFILISILTLCLYNVLIKKFPNKFILFFLVNVFSYHRLFWDVFLQGICPEYDLSAFHELIF